MSAGRRRRARCAAGVADRRGSALCRPSTKFWRGTAELLEEISSTPSTSSCREGSAGIERRGHRGRGRAPGSDNGASVNFGLACVPELPAAARGGASQTARPRNLRPSAAAGRDGFGDELAAPSAARAGTPASWPPRSPRPVPTDVEAETSSRPGNRRGRHWSRCRTGRHPDRLVRRAGPRRGDPVEGVHDVAAGGLAEAAGGSTSRPPARTRPRRRPSARRPLGETPVAALHPRRHQPTRAARPDPAHPARRGDAAELVGKPEALPRTKLLQQLKKHLGRAVFRVEEGGDARAWSPARGP